MMKRIYALLLAVCLTLTLFACGQESQEPPAGGLQPGMYTGTGTGHGGPIEIELTVDKAGRIAEVKVLSQNETPDYAGTALKQLPKDIAAKQSLGLDAVAGATLSSHGVLAAAADAVTQAGGDPKDYGFVPADERADGAEIAVTGLPAGEFTLTGAQLKSGYEIVELDTTAINNEDTERPVHAKGVMLEAVLQKHGASLKDFEAVTATAADGYSITIPGEVLRTRDLLLAFEIDGEAIDPRFVVPEERTMYWVKSVQSIALESGPPEAPVTKEIVLTELIEQLKNQAQDYEYGGAACKALPLELVLQTIGAKKSDFVTLRSADGLTKTEQYDTFAAQLLVFEGTPDAPVYTGPDLPEGMRLKHVVSIQTGGILVR